MKKIGNAVKTVAAACVVLFAGVLFSTWVLPAITEDRSEQVLAKAVTVNNPQKIIESPVIKADPGKAFPDLYESRELLNTSQVDENVSQAKNLFLKNVSDEVEILFNLKIDSVILEKYTDVWRVMPGALTRFDDPASGEVEEGGPDTDVSQDGQEPSQPGTGQDYTEKNRKLERARREEMMGDSYFVDVLFTDAKSTTWRITACGYQSGTFYVSCVKEDVDIAPISIFQEKNILSSNGSSKMYDAANLFLNRLSSLEKVNILYQKGAYSSIDMAVSSNSSEYFWQLYGADIDMENMLIAGFRKDDYTPVSYLYAPLQGNVGALLQEYLDKLGIYYGQDSSVY